MAEFKIAEGYVDVHLRDSTEADLARIRQRLGGTDGATLPVRIGDETGRGLRDIDTRMRSWANTHGQNVQLRADSSRLEASLLKARKSALDLAEATTKLAAAQKVSEEVAARLAREELSEAEATRLTTAAAHGLERAEIAQATAARAAASAADHLAAQQRQLARATALAGIADRLSMQRAAGNRRIYNTLLSDTRRRFGDLRGTQAGTFREMETLGGRAFRLIRSAGPAAFGAVESAGTSAFTAISSATPLMVAGVAGALAALPGLAVAAGGGITLGLGAGLAGLAIMTAAKNKQVQKSFTDLKSHVGKEMTGLAKPFEPVLIHVASLASKTFDALAPSLKSAFANMAPAVSHFADMFAVGLKQFGPLIDTVGSEFNAVLNKLGDRMPEILGNVAGGLTGLVNAVAGHEADFAQFAVDLSEIAAGAGAIAGPLGHAYDIVKNFIEFPDSPWAFIKDAIPPLNVAVGLWKTFSGSGDKTVSQFKDLSGATEHFAGAASHASSAASLIAGDLKKAGDASKSAGDQVSALTDALNRLFNPQLAVYKDTTRMRQGFQDLVKALKASHGALGLQTAKSRAARDAFAAQLDATSKLATDTLASTHSMGKARAATSGMIESLYKLAGSNKSARQQVDNLAQALGILPKSTTTRLKGEIGDLQSKIEAAKARLKTVPPSKRSAIQANIADLEKKVAAAKAKLAGLHDKRVIVTTDLRVVGVQSRGIAATKANGGIERYAGGGMRHDLPPHITNTPTVLYGEPETGGEAYIPMGPSKRQRSTGLLAEVAARFGLVLSKRMEDGGFLDDDEDDGDDWTDDVEAYANGGLRRRGRRRRRRRGPSPATLHKRAVAAAQKRAKQAEIKHDAGAKLIAGITASMLSSLSKIQSFATRVNDKIRSTFSGKTETRLLAWAKRIEDRMAGAAKQSEAIAAKIKEAKDYAATTKGNMLGTATLTNIGTIGNAADIKSGLGYRLDSLRAFSTKLSKLAKSGLNKTMLQQIIDAGPEQGGVLADMFLKDLGSIKSVNDTQKQIDQISTTIGNNAADAMYDSGKNASKGFLTGLYGQQAELNALMQKLGGQLAAGLAKAFGVHGAAAKAPVSKSGKKHGKKSGWAKSSIKPHAAGGIAFGGELAMFGEEGPELVRVGSTSRVFTAEETAAMTGGVTIQGGVHVHVEGTFDFSDPKAAERLAEQAANAIREKIRRLEKAHK